MLRAALHGGLGHRLWHQPQARNPAVPLGDLWQVIYLCLRSLLYKLGLIPISQGCFEDYVLQGFNK